MLKTSNLHAKKTRKFKKVTNSERSRRDCRSFHKRGIVGCEFRSITDEPAAKRRHNRSPGWSDRESGTRGEALLSSNSEQASAGDTRSSKVTLNPGSRRSTQNT